VGERRERGHCAICRVARTRGVGRQVGPRHFLRLLFERLAGGRHVVTATYLGSSTHKGSTATVTQPVS
jgi:hypothetical protein